MLFNQTPIANSFRVQKDIFCYLLLYRVNIKFSQCNSIFFIFKRLPSKTVLAADLLNPDLNYRYFRVFGGELRVCWNRRSSSHRNVRFASIKSLSDTVQGRIRESLTVWGVIKSLVVNYIAAINREDGGPEKRQ